MFSLLKNVIKRYPRFYSHAQRFYPFLTLVYALFIGRRGCWDHLWSTWSLLRKSSWVQGRPVSITLEPTNSCNLRCPICETGNGDLGRPVHQMSLSEFKVIIRKIASHTNTLIFYYMGETFLNRDAYQMIRLAKDLGIPWVTTCTNGESVDPELLVASGIDEVSFQIGGMSAETHSIYRLNGDFDRVMHNLKETLRVRRERQRPMRVTCGMILMKHNENEVSLFKKVMAAMGVDEALIVDPCVRNVAQGKEYLPTDQRHWYYDPLAFQSGVLRPRVSPKNRCDWLYYSLTILTNGDVVPCCRDAKGGHIMGNLLNQDLAIFWNSENFQNFRKGILSDQANCALCSLCSGYPGSSLK